MSSARQGRAVEGGSSHRGCGLPSCSCTKGGCKAATSLSCRLKGGQYRLKGGQYMGRSHTHQPHMESLWGPSGSALLPGPRFLAPSQNIPIHLHPSLCSWLGEG